MAAPAGNKNAKGNKGGGRKSAYAERADADLLWKLFTENMDKEKIVELIKTGKYSILDSFLSKAFAGSERHQIEMFKKLFPDTVNLTGNLNQKSMKALEGDVRGILEAIGTKKKGGEKKIVVKKK